MKVSSFKFLLGLVPLALLGSACTGGGDCATTVALPPPPGTGGFGDFAFEVRRDVFVGGSLLTGTAWHDMNGDGLQDVVELSGSTNQLLIGTGLSDGTYLGTTVLPTPAEPWSLAIGDYDGDGRDDIAVGCLSDPTPGFAGTQGQLALYLQDELGEFTLVNTTPLAGDPRDLHTLAGGAGDLDAVGRDDLLAALLQIKGTQRLRWDGGVWTLMGTFKPTSGGLATASPVTVTTIDLEADGDLDVVIGESDIEGAPDRVVAYTNDGFGGFFPAVIVLPMVATPIVESQGDVDGDGFEDLSIAQLGGTSALLLRGSETGLTDIDEVDFGGPQSGAVWRDLDGDEVFDVAATLVLDQAIAVRMQVPSGTSGFAGLIFDPATYYNTGFGPHDLAVRDLPDPMDTLPDLVCANSGDVSILFNQGGGEFLGARGYHVGGQPRNLVTADLDQDGIYDAVVLDQYQKQAVFLRGDGEGAFTVTAQVPLNASATETPGHLVVRDFDGDGREDVLLTVFESGEVRLMRNPGDMIFGTPSLTDATIVGSQPLGLDAADFNADGKLDVLVANSFDQTVQLLIGSGTGSFTAGTPMNLGGRTMAVFAGDIDGDGFSDAVVTMANPDYTAPRLAILQGDGAGGLTQVGSFPLGNVSSTIQAADLDLDGKTDLVFGQSTIFTDEITILMNQGDFDFSAATLVVGDDPGSLSIADIDGDGDADLVIPIGTGELRLALGDGTGGFPEVVPLPGSPFNLPVPFGTRASAFSDLTGDGLEDLLMVSPSTGFLWVARNLGSTEN
ncbi:MAG: VCBS repeat-containing protein [Planctomycetota bacterium]|nr:VCBS repeat-containing protein [Planctomycetota bacterium]